MNDFRIISAPGHDCGDPQVWEHSNESTVLPTGSTVSCNVCGAGWVKLKDGWDRLENVRGGEQTAR